MRTRHGHSRRHIVGRGGAFAAMLPFTMAARGGTEPLDGEPPSGLPKDRADAGSVAAQSDTMERLTVAVMIDDKGPFRFVVDTGADRTVMAEDVANVIGLTEGSKVNVQGIIRSLPANTVSVGSLSVGPIVRENLKVPLLPRALLGADGYLGLDVVNGYRVTLDFADRVLTVDRSRRDMFAWLQPPFLARVPAYGADGHLRAIDCHIDLVRTTAFVDTGAAITVGNLPLYNALVAENAGYVTLTEIPITGVTGGTVMGQVVALHEIRLNTLTFSQSAIAIADLPIFDLWGLADRPSLLIGMNWLRQFARVSVDYESREFNFELSELSVASRA